MSFLRPAIGAGSWLREPLTSVCDVGHPASVSRHPQMELADAPFRKTQPRRLEFETTRTCTPSCRRTGAMFIASLAIACGSWSRSTRLFQGIYTGWWYLAMNNVPNMDFTGITGQRHAWGYLLTATVLFTSAMAQRWWYTERAAALRLLGFFRGRPRAEKAVAM